MKICYKNVLLIGILNADIIFWVFFAVEPAPEPVKPVKEILIEPVALPVLKRGTLIKTLANLYKRYKFFLYFWNWTLEIFAKKTERVTKVLLFWQKRFLRYDIKMEFFLSRPKSKSQGWSNLVHFTFGDNCSKIGDRIPGKNSYLTDTSEDSKLVHRRICAKVSTWISTASERRVWLSAESKIHSTLWLIFACIG